MFSSHKPLLHSADSVFTELCSHPSCHTIMAYHRFNTVSLDIYKATDMP